ncbi:hypothetical protein NMY22_g14625 [Coprinellus aureogranulatus]|nr:hypothetical protein NMY22_g14625 [Coprinellus aureogranulatus]
MPILIRNNKATELCMTWGQEGRVVAWSTSLIPHWQNKRLLDVLYVELDGPPHKVKLPHLPENIVPLTKISQVLDARLPCNKFVRISRLQVPVLPNFSMTDYSSQGKTRTYNVVDITEYLRYKGVLPPTILQSTCWETIDRYRHWKTSNEEQDWHHALRDDRPEDDVPMPKVLTEVETLANRNKRKARTDAPKSKPATKKHRINRTHCLTFHAPHGPIWDSRDWSCAYDALTFIMYTLWKSDICKWSTALSQYGEYMQDMVTGFEGVDASRDNVEQITEV